MYKGKKIGVIIRAFNESNFIEQTLKGIPHFVDKIFLVDDASEDNTIEVAERFIYYNGLKNKCTILKHKSNKGAGGAIITGFKKAIKINELDIIAIMDGDNQMNPVYLINLIKPIVEKKADFTKGNRLRKGFYKEMSKFRLFGNYCLSIINKIVTGYWKIMDPQNGYIAINMNTLKKIDIDKLNKKYSFENDLMVKANIINAKMQNVLIPARYGNEESDIKYIPFIAYTSVFFIKAFFERISMKYNRKKLAKLKRSYERKLSDKTCNKQKTL